MADDKRTPPLISDIAPRGTQPQSQPRPRPSQNAFRAPEAKKTDPKDSEVDVGTSIKVQVARKQEPQTKPTPPSKDIPDELLPSADEIQPEEPIKEKRHFFKRTAKPQQAEAEAESEPKPSQPEQEQEPDTTPKKTEKELEELVRGALSTEETIEPKSDKKSGHKKPPSAEEKLEGYIKQFEQQTPKEPKQSAQEHRAKLQTPTIFDTSTIHPPLNAKTATNLLAPPKKSKLRFLWWLLALLVLGGLVYAAIDVGVFGSEYDVPWSIFGN